MNKELFVDLLVNILWITLCIWGTINVPILIPMTGLIALLHLSEALETLNKTKGTNDARRD